MNKRIGIVMLGAMISCAPLAHSKDVAKRDYIQQLENALKDDKTLNYKERRKLLAHLRRYFNPSNKPYKKSLQPLNSETQKVANLIMKSYKGISNSKAANSYKNQAVGMIELHKPAHKRIIVTPNRVMGAPSAKTHKAEYSRSETAYHERKVGSKTAPESTTRRVKQAGPGYQKSERASRTESSTKIAREEREKREERAAKAERAHRARLEREERAARAARREAKK